ncbi:hypothetical protein WN944_024396 [Citrus x changshan-huyou]|uniref:NB-ARC domain-containing protein n=1 Tax=Citrus x changshan-huyou TaxID=2935761 RepID=A0AAP0LNV0_9ROSI
MWGEERGCACAAVDHCQRRTSAHPFAFVDRCRRRRSARPCAAVDRCLGTPSAAAIDGRDNFDEFRIAKAIIEALEGSAPNLGELQSLLQHIYASIVGKRFFLVLDDVWTDDYSKWEPFHNCLMNGLRGSSSRHTSAGCVVEAARNILCNVWKTVVETMFYRVILGIAASHARFPELGNGILYEPREHPVIKRLWLAAVVCIALLVIKKCEHFVALLTNLTPVVWGGIGVR